MRTENGRERTSMTAIFTGRRKVLRIKTPKLKKKNNAENGEVKLAYDCSIPKITGRFSLLTVEKCREVGPEATDVKNEEWFLHEVPTSIKSNTRACKVMVAY